MGYKIWFVQFVRKFCEEIAPCDLAKMRKKTDTIK